MLSQIMVAQSENLSANYRMVWQFLPSIIAERMIHVPKLTMPTTKLGMSSFKFKSRIWWLVSQFSDVERPEYVLIHTQPKHQSEKVLREECCEFFKPWKVTYHKGPDSNLCLLESKAILDKKAKKREKK